MKEFKVKGSYYDIGIKNGEIVKFYIDDGYPPKFSQENLEKSKTFEKVIADYCPDLLDEFRGMAESSGVDYQSIVAFEATPYRLDPHCLVIGIASENTSKRRPILFQNHEWLEEDGDYLSVMTSKPNGKLASYGFTFDWSLLSRYGGINEAGLALTSTAVSFTNSGPGIMINIAQRWILDNFKTTEEAVEFLAEIPKVWGVNYLVIDRNETIAKVQVNGDKTVTSYSDNGFDMITIRYQDEDLHKIVEQETPDRFSDAAKRETFLGKWFAENKGTINEDKIIELMKDCNNGLHYHTKVDYGTLGTCWTWIISPKDNDVIIGTGAPCKNPFNPYKIDFSFSD